MISLLTIFEKRQLKLLDILSNSVGWLKIEEISENLDVPKKIIQNDISTLVAFSKESANLFQIKQTVGRGINLILDNDCSTQLVKSIYVKETLSYRLIDTLIQTNEISVEELLSKFYLSKSTLYRHVKRLNKELEKSKLEISLPMADILGEESAVREFMYYFYWSVAEDGSWPFIDISSDVLYFSVKKNTDFSNIKYSNMEVMQVMFRLAINFIRHSQKKFIITLEGEEYIDPFREEYLKSIPNLLPPIVPTEYRQNEELFLKLLIVSYPFLDERNLNYKNINLWYEGKNSEAYRLMMQILGILSEGSIDDQLANNQVLKFRIMAVSIYGMVFSQLHLQNALTLETNKQFANRLPEIYRKLKIMLNSFNENPIQHLKRSQLLIAEVYRVIEKSMLVNTFQPVIYVKIRCFKSPLMEPALKEELLKRVKHKLNVSITNDTTQSANFFDLFISDMKIPYTEEVNNKCFYLWQTQPTERDWFEITKLIDFLDPTLRLEN